MIYTSYFGNHRNYTDKKHISISRFSPKWYEGESIITYDEFALLAPTKELLSDYKYNNMSDLAYAKTYTLQLQKVNLKKLYDTFNEYVFLCYEKKGEFCHRRVFAFIMTKLGYQVREL